MKRCGIDPHLKAGEVYMVDEVGETNGRAQVPTTEKSFMRWFGNRAPARIRIEASGLLPWVARKLRGLCREIMVANA